MAHEARRDLVNQMLKASALLDSPGAQVTLAFAVTLLPESGFEPAESALQWIAIYTLRDRWFINRGWVINLWEVMDGQK